MSATTIGALQIGERATDLCDRGSTARIIDRTLRDPTACAPMLGRDRVQRPHGDVEALTLVADAVLGRNPHVAEDHLPGRTATNAELRLEATELQPQSRSTTKQEIPR